jgi:hypothetical protein
MAQDCDDRHGAGESQPGVIGGDDAADSGSVVEHWKEVAVEIGLAESDRFNTATG